MFLDFFALDSQGSISLPLSSLQSIGSDPDGRNCGLIRFITFQGTNLRTYYYLFIQLWHTDAGHVGGLFTQEDFVHRRRMILETHHTGQDQSRCLALRMRTRDLILGGVLLQVLLNLIHHLVGFGVLEDPMLVG